MFGVFMKNVQNFKELLVLFYKNWLELIILLKKIKKGNFIGNIFLFLTYSFAVIRFFFAHPKGYISDLFWLMNVRSTKLRHFIFIKKLFAIVSTIDNHWKLRVYLTFFHSVNFTSSDALFKKNNCQIYYQYFKILELVLSTLVEVSVHWEAIGSVPMWKHQKKS